MHNSGLAGVVLALAWMLSGTALAAGFSCGQPEEQGAAGPDQLNEVVVTGEQVSTNSRDLQQWLGLLAGKYTYEGYVDLCGQGHAEDQRPVTGKADCDRFGNSPTVHCTIQVRWPETTGENGQPVPGGTSSLFPALVSFSLETRYIAGPAMTEAAFLAAVRSGTPIGPVQSHRWGLMFTQVDNKGIAEWGSGELVGDTFTSREPCVGIDVPGACQKTTRVTASPDSDEIAMLVDVTIESRRVLRQAFLLHREPAP